MVSFWRPAAAGVASVLVGVGAGELVSSFVVQNGSPVLDVGALVIDLVPGWLKEAVIGLFGTGDKAVLVISLAIVLLAGAAVAGWLEWRWSPLGRILIGVGGAVGVLAALTRSGAGWLDAVPSAVAAVIGVVALGSLIRMLRTTLPGRATPNGAVTRRKFVTATGATAASGVLAVIVGQVVASG
ncbi:MAG: twin-arginine translocation signal domain-containing protein, partial [Actinomycetales bacterium]